MPAADLRALLEARTVAVVGASERPGSVGNTMMRQLRAGGFAGRIAPVNPNYASVEGLECRDSLSALDFEIDLALLGVSNERLEEQLSTAAAQGVRSAVIFGSGLGITDRLSDIARDAGMVICGGNCMGFVNFEHGLRALAFEEPSNLKLGGITWLTHSGSAFTALLHSDRFLRFNLAVSTGQELTTTMSDYMSYALERDATRVLALFIETVRDPAGFRAALHRAAALDVPVVALKVGRNDRARELVTAHSGALAGDDAAYEALFDAHGVVRVQTFNEMADVLELLQADRRAGPGALGAIHDSGGERAHLVDVAAGVGVPFAAPAPATLARIESALEPGLPAVNPLDAWGTGNDFEAIFAACAEALLDDDGVAAFAFVVDLAGEEPGWGYADVARRCFETTHKPFAVLSNLSGAIDADAAARLRGAGVPVLEDTLHGLRAFRHLFDYRDSRARSAVDEPAQESAPEVRGKWRRRFRESPSPSSMQALELLSDYGIRTVSSALVSGPKEALEAAASLGWPVALKTAEPDVAHKTEAGGVFLHIGDRDALRRAYGRLARSIGPAALVQQMAPPGVEMALGVVRDDQFGPLVMVAAGGVLIETFADHRFGLPPLGAASARVLIDRLRMRPLLDGVRGARAADVEALARAVACLSALALDLGDRFTALDVNPVIVGPGGCTAVDALIV